MGRLDLRGASLRFGALAPTGAKGQAESIAPTRLPRQSAFAGGCSASPAVEQMKILTFCFRFERLNDQEHFFVRFPSRFTVRG